MYKSRRLKILTTAFALCASYAAANASTCVGTCNEATATDGIVTLSPDAGGYRYISTSGGVAGGGVIGSVGDGDGGSTNTGSTFTSSVFSAAAGDTLQFYFNYVTSDGAGFSDYAWAELQTDAGAHFAWLFTARTQPTGNTSPGFGLPANDSTLEPASSAIIPGGPTWSPLGSNSGSCFSAGCGYTGWIKSTYQIAAAGNYQLLFGVQNWNDSNYASGLAFDGAQIGGIVIDPGPGDNGGGVPEVPLPAAIWLFGAALGGLGGLKRLARSRKAAA